MFGDVLVAMYKLPIRAGQTSNNPTYQPASRQGGFKVPIDVYFNLYTGAP